MLLRTSRVGHLKHLSHPHSSIAHSVRACPLSAWQHSAGRGRCTGDLRRAASLLGRAALMSCSRRSCRRNAVPEDSAFQEAEAAAVSPLQAFLVWLMANGVEGIGAPGSIAALYEGENGQRGVMSIQDIADGDLVFRIPMRLAITDFAGDEASEGLVFEGAPWSVRLACRLLRERAAGAASSWFPYLQVLPEAVPTPLQTFQWEDFAEVQYQPTQQALHQLDWLIGDAYPRLPDAATGGSTDEDFRWAMSVVHSRTFGSAAKEGGVGVRMMVPLADMLNHGGDEAALLLTDAHAATDNVRWALVPPDAATSSGWEMEVRASCDIAAGQELLLSYGERSSDDFFVHYAFLPPRNPHDDVVVFASIEEALLWHSTRFPLREGEDQGAMDRSYAEALRLAVAEGCLDASAVSTDLSEDAAAANIKMLAGCRVDSGLAAAFGSLQAGRVGVPPTEVVMAYRSEELLSTFPTGLLADLRTLAFEPGMPEEEEAHYRQLLKHYTNEGLLLAGIPQGMQQQPAGTNSGTHEQKADGASSVGSSPTDAAGKTQPAATAHREPSNTDVAEEACPQASEERGSPLSAAMNLALRFRIQKKLMLWDVLIAHERSLLERQN